MMQFFGNSKALGLGLMFLAGSATAAAPAAGTDADKRGGSDHPLVSRYAGSVLHTYGDETYGSAKVLVDVKGKPEEQLVEGKVASRLYFGPKGRTSIDVFRNYQSALASAGFEVLYQCEEQQCKRDGVQGKLKRWVQTAHWTGNDRRDFYVIRLFEYKPGFHYLHARKAGTSGQFNVQVAVRNGDADDVRTDGRALQFVQVIETSAVAQGQVSVNAAAIGSALKREGKIALYGVLFDTNEARIKTESADTLAQMAKSLKDEPQLNVFIVGHTDNQGSVDANLALSRRRAQAVVEALTKTHGIAATRLQAHGVANLSPAASNNDDAGRSKNRRVEMVVR